MSTPTIADNAPPPVVTFRIGRQTYALPLSSVMQVVRLPALTELAGAPPTICGLLNLRGELLPVISGRVLLSLPFACDLESQIMIISDLQGMPELGLLVDEVYQVRRFGAASFAPLEQGDAVITGALRSREETALLLDPQVLSAGVAMHTRRDSMAFAAGF